MAFVMDDDKSVTSLHKGQTINIARLQIARYLDKTVKYLVNKNGNGFQWHCLSCVLKINTKSSNVMYKFSAVSLWRLTLTGDATFVFYQQVVVDK